MHRGWKKYRLGDLGRVVTGRTPPTSKPYYFGDKYPFITPSDMDDRKKADSTQRYLSEEGAQLLHRNLIPGGSVAVSCIGWQMGKAIMTCRPSFTNQQLNTIIPNEKIDANFLYYALSTRRDELLSLGAATGVRTPILNKSAFSDLPISVPPLKMQRKAAAVLSAYDDLIENNTRRIALLEEMARLLYREWFVRFRFPGHESVRLVDSPLGPIPEGWEVVRLGQVADVNAETVKRGEEPEEIDYIDITSVSTGQINEIKHFAFDDAPGRARRVVRHSDIIWSTVRPNRKSYCLILNPSPNLIVSTGFAVISARQAPYTYLYHALTTDEFVGYLANRATGSAYPAVLASDFEDADLLLPPRSISEAFHGIVTSMFDQRENLARKNSILRRTRDLLLPRLVAGTMDVSNLDTAVDERGGAIYAHRDP